MAYKAQIIDLNSPNNIGSWAKIGQYVLLYNKTLPKGSIPQTMDQRMRHHGSGESLLKGSIPRTTDQRVHHHRSNDKLLWIPSKVKYLYRASNVSVNFELLRKNSRTYGAIRGCLLKLPDRFTIICLIHLHLMLDNWSK